MSDFKFLGPSNPGITACVVAGGHKDDKPEDESCGVRLIPYDGSESIDPMHFGFSQSIQPFSQSAQHTFQGVPEPGTIVYTFGGLGDTLKIPFGQAPAITKNGDGGAGGGQNLRTSKQVEKWRKTDIGVSTPPKIVSKKVNGVEVREPQETGDMHSLSLLEGLPNHAALFGMSGFRLPSIKDIPTALQTNDQMMTEDMMNQMMGQVMSLGQMFQGLMGKGGGASMGNPSAAGAGDNSVSVNPNTTINVMPDIIANLTPNMQTALTNLTRLVQGMETTGGVAWMTSDMVHQETYLQNAQALLSQVKSISDLMFVLQRLQWDTSLFGRENLDNVVVQIESAFGIGLQEIDYNGTITVTYDEAGMAAQNAYNTSFHSNTTNPSLSSAPQGQGSSTGSSSGGGAGQIASQVQSMIGNMFGQSSGTIQDMLKRLSPQSEKVAKKMHEKLNQDQVAQKQQEIVKKTTEGGDPLSPELFTSIGFQ